MYGFLAFIMTVRSEKLSRFTGLRGLATILLEADAMLVGEMGLVTIDSLSRLIRSSSASECNLARYS